ncbi:MAG: hypothetical protein FJ109_07675 [Deltaproteobacteria bacterium]|nr:hypothetical protein [Deltaproteobacteria bacterium]
MMLDGWRVLCLVVVFLTLPCCSSGRSPSVIEVDTSPDGQTRIETEGGGDVWIDGGRQVDGRPADVCAPECTGVECGPNGCGGTCGECAGEQVCSAQGKCAPARCGSTKDCPDDLVCDKERGVCVPCVVNGDCAEGEVCGADHKCHVEVWCESDKACKDFGMVCDLQAGHCVGCLTAADCPEEEFCKESWCLADVCQAGGLECQGQDVMACADDGSGWSLQKGCTGQQYCEAGECVELTCVPLEAWCDGETALACAADGKSVGATADCEADNLHCFEGDCLDSICVPDEKFCLDEWTGATCLEDGLAYSTLQCQEGTVCEFGLCAQVICEPASAWCDGNVAKACNGTGTALVSQTDCALGDGKVCLEGACVACIPVCEGESCGPDGCGGSCGECGPGQVCIAGKCPPPGDECDDGNDTPWDGCTDGKLSESFLTESTSRPLAGSLQDERFVLLQRTPSGGKTDLVAKVFDKAGELLFGPIQVAVGLGITEQFYALASLPGGGFAAAWTSGGEGKTQGLRLQRFLSTGAPDGPEQVVVEKKESVSFNPSIAALPDGRLLVVWTGWWPDSPPKSGPQTVFGRLYLPDGTPLQPIVVQSGDDSFPQAVATGLAKADRFGVLFQREKNSNIVGISGTLLDSAGKSLTGSISVTNCDSCWPSELDTVGLAAGGLLVAWDGNYSSQQDEVRGQRVGDDGGLLGEVFPVNSISGGSQVAPNLVALPDGGFVAVWSHKPSDSGWEVRVRCFDGAGTPLSGDVKANTSPGTNLAPARPVAFGDGTAMAIWHDGTIGIAYRRISSECEMVYE